MKKRSRPASNIYKEPSSDLSDLCESSDEEMPKKNVNKRAKLGNNSNQEEESKSARPKGKSAADSGKTYGKC